MKIKQRLKMGALEAGVVGTSALGSAGVATSLHTGIPMFVLIPIGVAAGAIGARQISKELQEESKRKKLRRVM